jgi:hypothetical protein
MYKRHREELGRRKTTRLALNYIFSLNISLKYFMLYVLALLLPQFKMWNEGFKTKKKLDIVDRGTRPMCEGCRERIQIPLFSLFLFLFFSAIFLLSYGMMKR